MVSEVGVGVQEMIHSLQIYNFPSLLLLSSGHQVERLRVCSRVGVVNSDSRSSRRLSSTLGVHVHARTVHYALQLLTYWIPTRQRQATSLLLFFYTYIN